MKINIFNIINNINLLLLKLILNTDFEISYSDLRFLYCKLNFKINHINHLFNDYQ